MPSPLKADKHALATPKQRRCLGPCKPEHLMTSTGSDNRVCCKCRKAQDQMNCSARRLEGAIPIAGDGSPLPFDD